MNIPNKLTIARIIATPIFIVFLMAEAIPLNLVWAFLVFILACITDTIDGKYARKHGLITDFGKFLDPLADKVLVIAALVCFIELGLVWSWLVVIIVTREFLVSGVRLVASTSGTVIAAGIWGKAKTVTQMVALLIIMGLPAIGQLWPWFALQLEAVDFPLISNILICISTVFAVASGVQYIWGAKGHLKDN
jgi:CDP-diacylglycerol--glycerol-3-phosphate 3-phosphatidyltransferase